MISILDAAGQQFMSTLNRVQASLNQAQQQVASGLKVSAPSDAPDQVSEILQLHAAIQRNQQIQTNLNVTQGDVTAASQGLQSGISLLDQVQVMASSGLGTNQTAATRTTLAGQVEGLMQQMVTLSQTQVDGRYIFSGDNDGSPSYQYDASAPSGVDQLQASTATRQMEDTTGTTYPVGLSATQIFDARDSSGNPASGNVFAAMNAVRTALLANDTTALQTAATGVQTASTYMNQQATFYGTAQNRITASLATANQQSVSLQQDLSNRQDADSTSAILEMQQYTTDMQAALASEAKLPHTTLFDALQG